MASSYAEVLRAHARELGEPKFITGLPCKRGHIGQRYVASGQCCECSVIAQAAQYRKKHPAKLAEPPVSVPAHSWDIARANNLAKYTADEPCIHDGSTQCYTSNGRCCVCVARELATSKPQRKAGLVAEAVPETAVRPQTRAEAKASGVQNIGRPSRASANTSANITHPPDCASPACQRPTRPAGVSPS